MIRTPALWSALLGAIACTDGPAPQPREAKATWHVDSIPFIDIGAQNDDTVVALGRPHSAAMVGDSLVVVGDNDFDELRFFSHAGALVRTVGRAGDGPGEYRYLMRILPCGDSLHVFDNRQATWRVYGGTGGLAREYEAATPGEGRHHGAYRTACNPQGVFINLGYASTDVKEPTRVRPTTSVWLSGSTGVELSNLGDFPTDELLATFPQSYTPHPLGKLTLVAIGSDRAYVGLSDSASILAYRLDGTLISSLATPAGPRQTTEADREQYRLMDTLGVDSRRVADHVVRWETFDFPTTIPAYSALLVDDLDLLWVRAYPLGSRRTVRWTALTSTGTFVGSADLPTALEVSGIGVDFVIGIETMPTDGSQRVRAYRLHR